MLSEADIDSVRSRGEKGCASFPRLLLSWNGEAQGAGSTIRFLAPVFVACLTVSMRFRCNPRINAAMLGWEPGPGLRNFA